MIKKIKESFGYIFSFLSLDCWLLFFFSTYSLFRVKTYFYTSHFYFLILLPFSLIIIGLYFYYDYKAHLFDNKEIEYKKKIKLVLVLIGVFLVGYLYTTFENSKKLVFEYTHDEIIVTEYAMEYLSKGKNPYVENYYNTPLENWYPNRSIPVMEEAIKVFNPAFVTYAYFPGQFLLPYPFYYTITKIFNWYDHRLFYFFCLIGIIILLNRLVKNLYYRLLLLISMPFFVDFFKFSYYGWNDLLILLFILLSLFFLQREKIWWSVVFLALAVASKQSAIFLLPYYFLYLYQHKKIRWNIILKRIIIPFFLLLLIVLAFTLPFIIWNASSFNEDVLGYQTGKSLFSYPLNGIGFSRFIYLSGLVKNVNGYYPFYIWQIVIVLPLVAFLLYKQLLKNSLRKMLLNYALTLFVIWFFSRSFLFTHLIYVGVFLPVAYFIDDNRCKELKGNKFPQISSLNN
ncbi:MAG: hypothetical protein ABIH38_05745 [Patescibacteria group bacterium]